MTCGEGVSAQARTQASSGSPLLSFGRAESLVQLVFLGTHQVSLTWEVAEPSSQQSHPGSSSNGPKKCP